MQISHQDLFPTRVWSTDLSNLGFHFEVWRDAIEKLRNSDMAPRGRSNRMGWNSQPMILTLPLFEPLLQECIKAFNFTIKTTSPNQDYRYGIEAWANVNDTGGFNMTHSHPNALMSSVFYLTVPEGSGALVLRDPRPGTVFSPFPAGGKAPNTAGSVKVIPKEGLLVIFPNWLEHQVEPHEGLIPRVSIAMNAVQAKMPL